MRRNIKLASIIANVLVIAITSAMLIGTTFAWFTDSATSTGNKIQAGTLKIDLEMLDKEVGWYSLKDENVPIFDYDRWEPGYTDVKVLKIVNKGTLALKWKAKIVSTKTLSALADVIDVYVRPSATELFYPEDRSLEYYTRVGTVAEFINNIETTTTGILLAGEVEYLGLALKMPTDVGNEYQGLDLGGKIDVTILATQVSLESDGFSDSYDKSATYPVTVTTAQSLKDAMLIKNAKIVLEEDIVVDSSTPLQYGSYMFLANGREVTIDLNGHDIIVDENTSKNLLYVFTTANGGTLNIVGDGTIVANNKATGIFWAMNKNDQINIYDGEFDTNGESWGDAQAILYATSGSIDVYGGKFLRAGHWCSNVSDAQGNRVCIVFHEGVLFVENDIQQGDASRVKLAEGCEIVSVEIDGETWYKVVKTN